MSMINFRYFEYIYFRASSTLAAEVSKTYLSSLWWVLEPALMLGVYYLVFGVLLDRKEGDFIPFLLIGVIFVQWFSSSIGVSLNSIRSNSSLLNQVQFPKLVLPTEAVAVSTFKLLIVLLFLIPILWVLGYPPQVYYIQAFFIFLLMIAFIWVCSSFCSILMAIVPDLSNVIPNVLRLTTYLSGVFYSIWALPEEYHAYFYLNPVAMFIDAFRKSLLYGELVNLSYFALLSGITLIGMFFVLLIFRVMDAKLPSIVGQS